MIQQCWSPQPLRPVLSGTSRYTTGLRTRTSAASTSVQPPLQQESRKAWHYEAQASFRSPSQGHSMTGCIRKGRRSFRARIRPSGTILETNNRYGLANSGMRTVRSPSSLRACGRSRALLGLALIALASGCGGIREVILAEVSPDESRTAYVVRVNSGGATTGFEYEVVVAFSANDFDPYTDRNWIWRSYRMPPTEISWDNPQSVRVQVIEEPHYEDMIQIRQVGGVRATTATLPGEATEPASTED